MLCHVKKRHFFILLEILLVLVIIAFICYMALRNYFNKPAPGKYKEDSFLKYDFDTSSAPALLESTKKKIKNINKRMEGYQKELDKLR